jgi:hypothetical protein
MKYDDTYRVGRCPNSRCPVRMGNGFMATSDRPAFAWKANTGLRLDDGMRCPRCGNLLGRTSREAFSLREFTEDELLKVFEQTRRNLAERVLKYEEMVEAGEREPKGEARDYRLGEWRRILGTVRADQVRVEDGYRRWLSSGSDEHDAAVKSGW